MLVLWGVTLVPKHCLLPHTTWNTLLSSVLCAPRPRARSLGYPPARYMCCRLVSILPAFFSPAVPRIAGEDGTSQRPQRRRPLCLVPRFTRQHTPTDIVLLSIWVARLLLPLLRYALHKSFRLVSESRIRALASGMPQYSYCFRAVSDLSCPVSRRDPAPSPQISADRPSSREKSGSAIGAFASMRLLVSTSGLTRLAVDGNGDAWMPPL